MNNGLTHSCPECERLSRELQAERTEAKRREYEFEKMKAAYEKEIEELKLEFAILEYGKAEEA